jgi:hypothetical protein
MVDIAAGATVAVRRARRLTPVVARVRPAASTGVADRTPRTDGTPPPATPTCGPPRRLLGLGTAQQRYRAGGCDDDAEAVVKPARS